MMHGFHKGLERRVADLERRLAAIPKPETHEQTERRLELCQAALEGRRPNNLASEEVERFAKMCEYVPIWCELIEEGILSPSGEPLGQSAPPDDLD